MGSITTKTRTATVGRAMRQRPISGLRLRSRAQGIRVPKPAVPISTMYPTPKSKGCLEQKSHQRGRTGKQTDNEQDTQRNLGRLLNGSCDRGVANHEAQDSFPDGRRVTCLDVVVNHSGIARDRVGTFTQILKRPTQTSHQSLPAPTPDPLRHRTGSPVLLAFGLC